MKIFLTYGLWPSLVFTCLWLHTVFLNMEIQVVLSTYLPFFAVVPVITFLEFFRPYSREWMPQKDEIKTDICFLAIVQILFEKCFTGGVIFGLMALWDLFNLPTYDIWPHHFPLWGQTVMIVFLNDLLHYVVHRASHRVDFLWRFHKVHHSCDKFYWLTVARFHPIDKGIQHFCSVIPFIFIGVPEVALSYYYVFYFINSILQHSNLDLKLGFLNYIVSTPYLHQWHHSTTANGMHANYGNNLIVWDTVFGTKYSPSGDRVRVIGPGENHYPKTFLRQLLEPFSR